MTGAPPRVADGAAGHRLGYLSGAPRVTTHNDNDIAGPRSHILGVMQGFRELGWTVEPYIVGDRMPAGLGRRSAAMARRGGVLMGAGDVLRLAMRVKHAREAWRVLGGRVDWVYERFALFQALGAKFRRHGVPWILETQGPFFEEARHERKSLMLHGIARDLELRAYGECDALVCVSEALRDILVERHGVPVSKTLVVPNGVDLDLFDPARHPARRSFEGFTIGYVGGLPVWQGLQHLIRAVARLRAEGIPLHIAVVGDGASRAEWEAQSLAAGLAPHACRFLGSVRHAEIPALLAGFDVGYSGPLPSLHDRVYHSPLKIYEYLAMGLPVIASASDDARALVVEGETGFRFTAADDESLCAALRRAWQARACLPQLGAAARETIVRGHGWTARVAQIVAGVEAMLGAAR